MSKNGGLVLGYMPGGTGIIEPFHKVFDFSQNLVEKGFADVDAIVIWGGEDVCPSYYNEKPNRQNDKQNGPSNRDKREWAAMKYAKIHNIPIIGVCRGAQFLCVLSGGSLVQHVTGHNGGAHNLTFADKSIPDMSTTSCHHQMMYPWKTDYQLLAWSSERRSNTYQGGPGVEHDICHRTVEPEIVYFPKTRGLAIQGHPEWMSVDAPLVKHLNGLVRTLLLKEEATA